MSEIPLGDLGETGDTELEGRREVLKNLVRRYWFLKTRAAAQGIMTDPAVLIEIEVLEKQLEKAKRQLEGEVAIQGTFDHLDRIRGCVDDAETCLRKGDGEGYQSSLGHAQSCISRLLNSGAPDQLYGKGDRWAVLVGVNEYEDRLHYGQLHVCIKDARAIHGQLTADGFAPVRTHLLADDTSELPKRETILATLKAIAHATEPDDLLLFYYSGHGDVDGGESYLVARNSQRLILDDTAVRVSRIKEIMERAAARAKVIVLDACHSGADIGGKGPKQMSAEFINHVFDQAEGLAILASCKQGELSHEWQERERSVFTYYLLEAFAGKADRDGKGFVTVQDVNRHVTNGVKLWASQCNVIQTPTLQYTVAGDIMLCTYKPPQRQ